ncbi:MAG: hypothetical protein ABIG93_03070 [archaeon]|nr:hypothetical protein [Nanoarchaeota archaeon]
MLKKIWIKREITLVHLLMLLAGKLFIGISVGMIISHVYLPYTYPLMALGILIFLPSLYYAFKEERDLEKDLVEKLRKGKKKLKK